MTVFRPRRDQKLVLDYEGGLMGISAVPGSGKTRTLAELAAKLVAGRIDDDQEVLVVTLVNSAVDNFKSRINDSVKQRGLLPNFGYRVRTLHGLSHDIVRDRPGLVGLSEDFAIIDEREAGSILADAVEAWLRSNPDTPDSFLDTDLGESRAEWVKRTHWPRLARGVAAAFVKRAKDLQFTPEVLAVRLSTRESQASLFLAQMGVDVYGDYQRSLAYRGAVDFDDLIRLALEALQADDGFLERLRRRWPFILEDEAQDSSELQERILRFLVGDEGNWVRVGDPNQAIYDTFTNANPEYLRDFLGEMGVQSILLPESGRSQPAIIDLANYLVDWTVADHPEIEARRAFEPQHIVPTGPGDPQPNPPVDLAAVKLVDREFTPDAELLAIVDSLERWLPDHGDWTCAVLTPRNKRGFDLIDLLRQRRIPYLELLRSTSVTRQTAGALGNLLRCLADATSAGKLADAFLVWRRKDRADPEAWSVAKRAAGRIRRCSTVEAYLWPRAGIDWLEAQAPETSDSDETSATERVLLLEFRETAKRWHRAAGLPIDQLILTLANDLFRDPAKLALAHKLAVVLRDVSAAHPAYRLTELVEELAVIARNERRFLGFTSEDAGFEPPKGKVTVATMHKAKGLEWDRVYLMSVNNYSFPSGMAHDQYIAERWFVRDNLNLEAETLSQLELLADMDNKGLQQNPSLASRVSYVQERLRLFYVGITRARRDLVITWNTGRRRGEKLTRSAPFVALHHFWLEHNQEE